MEVRNVTEDDEPKIRDLFALCFNKELSHEEWEWKYRKSPWGSSATVAVEGDEIIAHYGGIRTKFYFNYKTYVAFQFCDVMTHPEYRGRLVSKTPLIAMLGEMFYRENPMDFAFGFPSLRHAKLQSIRLGGEGYRLVRLYKKERLKKSVSPWRLKVKEGWESQRFDDIDRLAFQHSNKSLRLAKCEKYIKWRYIENPARKYKLLVFKRFNMTKGYVIYTADDGWFNLLEIFCDSSKDLNGILNSAESYAVNNMSGVKGIRAWFHMNEHSTKNLEALGYDSEDHIPIAFKSVNKECGIDAEVFYESFFYRMGDYDAS